MSAKGKRWLSCVGTKLKEELNHVAWWHVRYIAVLFPTYSCKSILMHHLVLVLSLLLIIYSINSVPRFKTGSKAIVPAQSVRYVSCMIQCDWRTSKSIHSSPNSNLIWFWSTVHPTKADKFKKRWKEWTKGIGNEICSAMSQLCNLEHVYSECDLMEIHFLKTFYRIPRIGRFRRKIIG